MGLAEMQGAIGSDIMYEDAESMALDRWNQMRWPAGFRAPGDVPQRRLTLWVDGHGSITQADITRLDDLKYLQGLGANRNPNIIRDGALPADRNLAELHPFAY